MQLASVRARDRLARVTNFGQGAGAAPGGAAVAEVPSELAESDHAQEDQPDQEHRDNDVRPSSAGVFSAARRMDDASTLMRL